MTEMRVEPGVGIGPIRFGMTHAEVCAAVANREITGQGSRQRIPGLGLLVEYTDSDGVVAFIEADCGSGAQYNGIGLFETPAEEVVAAIVQAAGLAPEDFPPRRHSYLFESLRLVLWRSTVPAEQDEDEEQDEEDEAEDGHLFQTVSLYAPGYYPEETLQYLRGRR
jgi:hypothetical protein